MWPPQSVKRWRTPSRASTFVTSSPPVTSAIDRRLPEAREDVGGEALDLLGGPLHTGDEADHEGAGAGLDEARQRLGALCRRPEHGVLLHQLVEGLVVLAGQVAGGSAPRLLPVVVDDGERQVGGLETPAAIERAPRLGREAADLLEA